MQKKKDLKGCVKTLIVQQGIRELEKKGGRKRRREGRKEGLLPSELIIYREKLTTHQFRSPDVNLLHSSA